jgi:hypothetical protein
MIDASETRSLALHFSRDLAQKLAPTMRELSQKLKEFGNGDDPSPSAILLLTAMGFVLTEEGDFGAVNRLAQLSAELNAESIPRHVY